uniref:Uncharacterized protein n=1 Tax=Anopheles melas TaxID=34690 RepID=A0A182TLY1_9DIPT
MRALSTGTCTDTSQPFPARRKASRKSPTSPSSRYRSRKVTALVTNSNRAARDEAILLNALPPCVQPPTETISRRCGNRSFRSRNRSNPFCPASSSYSGLRELMREVASSTATNAYATDSSFSYPIHWLPRYAYGHCPIASQTVRQLRSAFSFWQISKYPR